MPKTSVTKAGGKLLTCFYLDLMGLRERCLENSYFACITRFHGVSYMYVNHSWWCLGKYLHLCHVCTTGVAENCFPNGGGGGQD